MKNMILITAILILLPGCRDGLQVVITDKQGGDTPDKEGWVTTDENGVITDEYATVYNTCWGDEGPCPFVIKTSDGNTYTSFESYDLSNFTSEKGKVKLTYRLTEQKKKYCHSLSESTFIIDVISIELNNDGWSPTMIEPISIIGPGSGFENEVPSRSNMVITNSSDWELLLDKIYLIEVDNIDFSRHMVIAVFLGRISSGSEAYIQHIIENKDDITVEICHSHSVTTDAFSDSPFHVVKVPITGKPIVFEYIIEPIPL